MNSQIDAGVRRPDAEKLTDWVEDQVSLFADDRFRQRLPKLASSNCRKEALVQRLDRRVLDRLRETCTMAEVIRPNQRDRAVQRPEKTFIHFER